MITSSNLVILFQQEMRISVGWASLFFPWSPVWIHKIGTFTNTSTLLRNFHQPCFLLDLLEERRSILSDCWNWGKMHSSGISLVESWEPKWDFKNWKVMEFGWILLLNISVTLQGGIWKRYESDNYCRKQKHYMFMLQQGAYLYLHFFFFLIWNGIICSTLVSKLLFSHNNISLESL